MYGQNKTDGVFSNKGRLDKSAGIPVQDANGIAPVGGLIQPTYHTYHKGNADNSPDGIDLSGADPYAESATQLFPYGSTLNWGDRVFVYGGISSAGAVTAGKLVQQQVHVANHSQMAATATTAAGETAISVETVGTNMTLNQYAGGYLYVNDVDGEGQSMRVKSNPAHVHGTDPSVVITTYDPLVTALSTSSQLSIIANPYADMVVAPAAETGAVTGVTNIDMTASYFGWFQIRGPKACLADDTLVLGNNAVRGGSTAGAVGPGADNVLQPLGQVMASVVVDTEYALIWLNIV